MTASQDPTPHPKHLSSCTVTLQVRSNGITVNKYPAKQHAWRVASQLRVKSGLIYLAGQSTELLEDSDQPVPFRQRRYFFYMSGVTEPDCHVTYDIGKDVLTLYVPDFDLRRAIWMGPTLGMEEAREKYDVDEVKYVSDLASDIDLWEKREDRNGTLEYIIDDAQIPPRVQDYYLSMDDEALKPAMDACRVIKDDHEIGLIRRANQVSTFAHTAVLLGISQMKNEAQIHGTFLETSIINGARNQSYDIIAASGENAAVLHYTKNNEPLEGRQLVCLDAGAEWDCYASDVTRTFPTGGEWPSQEVYNIYSLVEVMQEECISGIKEGVRYLDLHNLAHEIAILVLRKLGIFRRGSIEEIRKSGASKVFFPHGLGHHVGLEVHDVSPKSLMALDDKAHSYDWDIESECYLSPCTLSAPVLEAGMVVTVEPGIYFSRLALEDAMSKESGKYINMEVVERYMPVGGVRIEDDILVTKDGFENLTTAVKGDAMLEDIRKGQAWSTTP